MAVTQTRPLPRIVIVDDDPGSRATLAAALDDLAVEVVELASGAELLRRLRELTPDVILLDVLMPELDGLAVCRRLKREPATRAIPIVLITALDAVQDLVRGLDAGADEFLSKPVARLELQARVRTMLRVKAQVDELAQALALRERLADVAAHELRTPLTAVLLQLELLRRRGELSSEQAQRVATALAEAQSMSAYLDDMLVLVRLEQGRQAVQRRPVDVERVVRSAADKLGALAQARGVILQATSDEPLPVLAADPLLLPRLVENLAIAALKCAQPEGRVLLRVTLAASGLPPVVRIEARVWSTAAPAAPPTIAEGVWAGASTASGGLGGAELELTFCRTVADVHGGSLASHGSGDDLAFVVTLPLVPAVGS